MSHIYETIIYNHDGSKGSSYVEGGLSVNVSSPTSSNPGANPEQLLGLAWATCLNATVKSILERQKLDNPSYVRVTVRLWFEEKTRYHFTLHAEVAIKDLDMEKTRLYTETAHRFCPVSKLIGSNKDVTIEAIPF